MVIMKIKELIEKLHEYNENAIVEVIVNNYPQEFSICYGGSDGVTKEECDSVSFYVDDLCNNEI